MNENNKPELLGKKLYDILQEAMDELDRIYLKDGSMLMDALWNGSTEIESLQGDILLYSPDSIANEDQTRCEWPYA